MLTSLQTPENWTCLTATSATYQAGQSLTCPSSHPLSNSDVCCHSSSLSLSLPLSPSLCLSLPLSPSLSLSLPLSPSLSLSLPLSSSLSLSLPYRIFSHSQLTEIVAGYNKLTAIPPAIGTLCLLTVLDLRYIHTAASLCCHDMYITVAMYPVSCHILENHYAFHTVCKLSAFFHCIMTL